MTHRRIREPRGEMTPAEAIGLFWLLVGAIGGTGWMVWRAFHG